MTLREEGLRDALRRFRLGTLCHDWSAVDVAVGDAFSAIGMKATRASGHWVIACGVKGCLGHSLAADEPTLWHVDRWYQGSFEGALEAIKTHRRLKQ